MGSLTAEHNAFIKDTTKLSDEAKQGLVKDLTKSLDLMGILENPSGTTDLVESLLALYQKEYLPTAVKLGEKFGQQKIEAFHANRS